MRAAELRRRAGADGSVWTGRVTSADDVLMMIILSPRMEGCVGWPRSWRVPRAPDCRSLGCEAIGTRPPRV